MLIREPKRRILTACYRGYDLAVMSAIVYFLSILLATSRPQLRLALPQLSACLKLSRYVSLVNS